MILAGDIGGTNTRLAFFDGSPDRLKTIVIEVFPSGEHDGPAAIAKEFLVKHKQKVDAACFGIAGAVVGAVIVDIVQQIASNIGGAVVVDKVSKAISAVGAWPSPISGFKVTVNSAFNKNVTISPDALLFGG